MCHVNRVLDGNVFKYTYYELESLICLLYMSIECIYHCIIISLYISTLITKMCRFIPFKLVYPHYVCSSVFKEKGHLVYISFDSTKLEKSLTCVAVVQRYLVGKCVPPTWSALLCVLPWFLQPFSGPLSVPPKHLSDSPTLCFLWLLPCKTPVFFSDTSFLDCPVVCFSKCSHLQLCIQCREICEHYCTCKCSLSHVWRDFGGQCVTSSTYIWLKFSLIIMVCSSVEEWAWQFEDWIVVGAVLLLLMCVCMRVCVRVCVCVC